MKIHSDLAPKAYRSALKERMGSRWDTHSERIVGSFLGPFFTVTHHCDWEFNRRITSESNSAIGYIRKTETGCELRFFLTKGLLYPAGILLPFAIFTAVLLFVALAEGFLYVTIVPHLLCFSVACTLFAAVISAFAESFTENSEQGRKTLLAALIDPTDPFAYLHHQNEL